MSTLPGPPVLKTTIIQLNKDLDSDDNNFEILTNEFSKNSSEEPVLPLITSNKKKRRRSTANVNSHELAKRKNETKQLHSIIEKRRRIKINREFEALKYLIPACKSTTNSPQLLPKNSNGSKIDGMYKLTILKSSVEYILYLHNIILNQSSLLKDSDLNYNFDDSFADIQLNVNQYRNIDKEFDFKNLQGIEEENNQQDQEEEEKPVGQLPSPQFTPDMLPRKFSVPISPHTILSGKINKDAAKFSLPDPAIDYKLPQKKYFKSQIPGGNLVIEDATDHEASRALLALGKSSIDSLLN